jgi:plasmid stabilization system protein ParE
MSFAIFIDPRALHDVQDAIDFYETQQIGLGRKFEKEFNTFLRILEDNPFFRKRYDNVRCLPLKKYPYMIHFEVVEEMKRVIVRAVFHTSIDADKWQKRK